MAKKILIVDDEADITDSFKVGLERQGFSVDTYNDPTKALSDFVAGAYDVIILDIRMPKMNGFELFRALAKMDKGAKFCFLTAFEVYKDEFRTLFPDLDIKCFLRKPISISDLVARVKKTAG